MVIFQIITLYLLLILTHIGLLKNYFFYYPIMLLIILIFSIAAGKTCIDFNKNRFQISTLLAIFLVFVSNILNTIYIHSNIIGGITFICGAFSILTLYCKETLKPRLIWISLILILCLPIREYLQIFFGVPLRLWVANALELIFRTINITTVNQNSILIFENNISNLDYPCSGSSSIYYTFLLISILGLIKSIQLNFTNSIKIISCIFFSILLNSARIFVLILLSLNTHTQAFGEIIHIPLGIINFLLVSILLFCTNYKTYEIKKRANTSLKAVNYILIALLIVNIPLYVYKNEIKTKNTGFEIIKNPVYQNLELSNIEKSLYGKYGAKVEKYKNGEIVVIKITSTSWKALHNPELCLKNQGFRIISSKTCINKNFSYRELTTDNGYVYYYFTDGEKYLDDYYKKTFFSIFSKTKFETSVLIYSPDKIDNFKNLIRLF